MTTAAVGVRPLGGHPPPCRHPRPPPCRPGPARVALPPTPPLTAAAPPPPRHTVRRRRRPYLRCRRRRRHIQRRAPPHGRPQPRPGTAAASRERAATRRRQTRCCRRRHRRCNRATSRRRVRATTRTATLPSRIQSTMTAAGGRAAWPLPRRRWRWWHEKGPCRSRQRPVGSTLSVSRTRPVRRTGMTCGLRGSPLCSPASGEHPHRHRHRLRRRHRYHSSLPGRHSLKESRG